MPIFIAFLLKIPLVHFLGGLLLVYIAYKVLIQDEGQAKNVSVKDSMTGAIWTIISADIVMSMDNVVAVAGASAGNYLILALGVLISIPIMIFGSKIILSYMERYPWIAYIGSGILAWTAGGMIIGDELIRTWFNLHEMNINIPFTIIVTASRSSRGVLAKQENRTKFHHCQKMMPVLGIKNTNRENQIHLLAKKHGHV